MLKIYLNGNKINVFTKESTIFQCCTDLNIRIPAFCYNKKLNISGNCRACLVEVLNAPKPVVSCSVNVIENMSIYTNSPLVLKVRETVLELLLINHPIDCAICDQGGECDLQNKSMSYGNDFSRFYNKKSSVEDKAFGPLIKTVMVRCINCSRCVRFAHEIGLFYFFGMAGRKSEITAYTPEIYKSELSGNCLDYCPVSSQ